MKGLTVILAGVCIIVSIILMLYVGYSLVMNGIEERIQKLLKSRGREEINMTTAKMQKINGWMSHLDQQTMDLSDQLAVTQATMEYLAKLEPIYDKYNSTKETRYR